MNEAAQVFRETETERKKIAYGARNKRRGGGKTVRMPSDYMSRKEREALNGEIIAWKEKPFYTLEEFKALPDDVQLQHVNSIMARFDTGISGICEVLWPETRNRWLRDYMTSKGLMEYVNGSARGRAAEAGKERLRAAFNDWRSRNQKKDAEADPGSPETPEEPEEDAGKQPKLKTRVLLLISQANRDLGVLEGIACALTPEVREAACRAIDRLDDLIRAMGEET